MPAGAQHVHDFDKDCSKGLAKKMKVLVDVFVNDPARKVSCFYIWGALAKKKGIDLSSFPATAKNKSQVS